MWDLAVREDDYDGIGTMLARYRGPPPLSFRLVPAVARTDRGAVAALLAEARTLESRQLQIAARYAASYLEDLALADSLARLDLAWRERPANRAAAQVLLAGLAAAGGRWTAARDAFRVAESMEGAGMVGIYRALTATLPMLPVPESDLRAIREDIARWGPTARMEGSGLAVALQPHLRLYLLGLLSSRLGDVAAAERSAAELERLQSPPGAQGTVLSLASTLRADVAWTRGQPQEALAALGGVSQPVPLELIALPRPVHFRIYGQEHARLLRALALAEIGRDVDALAWLRYGFRGSPQEFLFLGPVHRHMGDVFERLGQPDSAIAHYEKFSQLWARSDSGARPQLDDVRRRLVRLGTRAHP